jgi:nitric oxide dioxygenase
MLSAREIELIKNTAPVLAAQGEEITGRFYELLFEQHPALKNIFNMNNQDGGSQKHALARAVYAFASHVDNLEAILGEVDRIAHKHASLGVVAEHYPLVGAALLLAIKQVVNPPAEVLDAWEKGYGVLADVFIQRESELYQQKSQQPGGWQATRPFNVVGKERESAQVTSFYLAPQDGKPVADYRPGQYIAVYITPEGAEHRQIRQYSVSDSHKRNLYRISVKREPRQNPDVSVSNYLHEHVDVGDTLNISNPFGEFFLQESDSPVVLISGGVGITPMQAMLETLVANGDERQIHFVHGAQSPDHHSFSRRLQQLSDEGKVTPYVFYEQAAQGDEGAVSHYRGRTDLTEIGNKLPVDNAEFYLCGPLDMMKAVYSQLKALKVPDSSIFYEVFGPTKSLAD